MAKQSKSGFTLVEMSFVLVIMGLVIMIVFPALKSIKETTQIQATQTTLDTLMRASAAYTQAHGCLPCPTPETATGSSIGLVRGDATNGQACGTCAAADGLVPFSSLGLPERMAKDGWGNWVTMRVDPALTINFGTAPPASVCLSSDPSPCVHGESRKGLCQENLSSANRISVKTRTGSLIKAAILFVSHGKNGKGSFRHFGSGFIRTDSFSPPCAKLRGFEHCNADGNNDFVDGLYSNGEFATFDDHLRYLGRDALVSYLGNAACQTEW